MCSSHELSREGEVRLGRGLRAWNLVGWELVKHRWWEEFTRASRGCLLPEDDGHVFGLVTIVAH